MKYFFLFSAVILIIIFFEMLVLKKKTTYQGTGPGIPKALILICNFDLKFF